MEEKFTLHPIKWSGEKAVLLWDYYSANLRPEQYFSHHSGSFILKALRRYLSFEGNVLDFGCGPGFLIIHLLREVRNGTVYGLDFSSKAVSETNERYKGHPLFGGATLAQGLPSPLEASSMDVIICVEVIEHLDDEQLEAMLVELNRLLKGGGTVVLTTPNEEDLEANKTLCPECGCIFHRWQHIRTWNETTLRGWLETHHFEPRVVQAFHFQSPKDRLMEKCLGLVKKFVGRNSPRYRPHLFAVARKHD